MNEKNDNSVLIEWNGKPISIPYSTYIEILMEYALNPVAHESEETEKKINNLISPFVEENC